jgi:MAE_28990/MAE_18760-like HEPN
MPAIDLNALRAEMEAEREWREREMRLLRNQVASLATEEQRRIARKMLVVMLYAHFEGVCKALLSTYVARLNALGLTVNDVGPAIGAASLSEVFKALRDSNKKCKEFVRLLPNDESLHRFAREREFVEVAWQIATRSVCINVDKVVDTESNLKPVVLRKILFQLGLDPKIAEPWEGTIDHLLRRRNDVAHGTAKDGLEEKNYVELEQAVALVVDDIVKVISRAVSEQMYLATRNTGDASRLNVTI